MPSSYSPPDVIVEQHQRTRTAPRLAPQLPVVVVGPARQIVTRESAGTYEAGEEFQARLPGFATGALLDSDSLQVFLHAYDANGIYLGLFAIDMGTDGELLPDGETIRLYDTLSLEYSILSNRNNDQPDTLTNDDRAFGEPNGVWFTDEDVDFLGRGASLNSDTFLVIDSPSSMAGRYRVTEFVPSGDRVHTVKLLKVDANNVAELQKAVEIDAAALPSSRFVYGFPTDHFLGTAAGGTNTSNLTAGTVGYGIGVDDIVTISTGKTELDATDIADILADGAINIPDQLSGDAVWMSPGDPGDPATLTGVNTPAWQDALNAAQVGDWVRFTGDFGGGSDEIRDYKIIAIDLDDWEIRVQNSDLGGSGTFALDLTSPGWPDLTSIQILRMVKTKQDQANATGDTFDGTAQGVPFSLEILSATPGYIELADDLPSLSGVSNTEAQLIRGVPFRNSDASYDILRQASTGFSGDVLTSYQAQRTDLSLNGLVDIGDQEDIESLLGVIHPDNPLALMADMVTRSGLTDGNRVFFALATDGDTVSDYNAALDALTTEDVYFVVPATDNPTVISAFKAHVDAQSQPENKHERVLIASTALPTYDHIIPSTDEGVIPQGTVSAITTNRISTDSPNTIDWGRVRPGMVVKVLSSGSPTASVIEEQRIKDVNASLGYAETLADFSASLQGSSVYFRIDTYPRTKSEQAEAWRDEAKGYADKRMMLIRPDRFQVTYTDKTGTRPTDRTVVLSGCYAAAAFAGLCSSLAPQKPLTNVPVPGLGRVIGATDYFTPDQLNTIAEGGNNILVQSTANASPYSRHQMSTDVSSLETREWSITKAVDYAAKFFRGSLRPYIGKHNITKELLAQLRGISEAILRALKGQGVMLERTKLEKLYQDPDQPDGVIVEVALDVPYPCNRIVVKLYI
jgi:hypothetical protein